MKLIILALFVAVGSATVPSTQLVANKLADTLKDLAANALNIDREDIEQIAQMIDNHKPDSDIIMSAWQTIIREFEKSSNAVIAEVKDKLPDDYMKIQRVIQANFSR